MTRYAFYTLGCRANQYQTDRIKSEVQSPASEVVGFSSAADVYVINTCTVTYDAERKSRQAIRRALRQNPKARVIVTGCFAKLEADNLKKLFPTIEIHMPSSLVPRPSSLVPQVRANLMVQDGCEHFCSYCIVPYARGKVASKPIDQAAEEAEQLVKAGAREIVLTGINLATYEHNLSSLVSRLSSIVPRLRLSSLEPMYLKRELIDSVADNPRVCRHFHLPLQSGDDNILKAMNRSYTREDYLRLVEYIRRKVPDCGITTDIIVGFPGEGEKEFANTVKLIEQARFSRLHVFPYSARRGTPAADLPGQVDPGIKKQRNRKLLELNTKLMKEFAAQYTGREVEVLVEQPGLGLTSNYIRCSFNDPGNSLGAIKSIFARFATDSGEIRGQILTP